MNTETPILDVNEARELGVSMLRSGHQVRFKLGGNSMFPFLKNGDVAVVGQLPINQIKRGQIVVFEQQDRWIAHRVVKIEVQPNGKLQFVTRGDSARRSDLPFNENGYLGAVLRFTRDGKQYGMDGLTAAFYAKLMLWLQPIPQWTTHLFLRLKNRLQRG